ncbi:hypothetical protein BC830DRAFT_1168830, partial [Chytriomyces sp. MP71]
MQVILFLLQLAMMAFSAPIGDPSAAATKTPARRNTWCFQWNCSLENPNRRRDSAISQAQNAVAVFDAPKRRNTWCFQWNCSLENPNRRRDSVAQQAQKEVPVVTAPKRRNTWCFQWNCSLENPNRRDSAAPLTLAVETQDAQSDIVQSSATPSRRNTWCFQWNCSLENPNRRRDTILHQVQKAVAVVRRAASPNT